MLAAMTLAKPATPSPKEPSHAEIVWACLQLNDHVAGLNRAESMTQAQRLSQLIHASRFNVSRDFVHDLSRASMILENAPSTRPDLQGESWRDIIRQAFNCDFQDYIVEFLGPLTTLSGSWGISNNTPFIDPANFGENLRRGRTQMQPRLNDLSIALSDAQRQAAEATDEQLHKLPPFFFRSPLISFPSRSVCLSPSLLRGQLKTGIWGRCLRAFLDRNFPNETWHQVFGTLFDQYCERVAADATARSARTGNRYLSVERRGVGTEDEIEDVVITQGTNTLLLSGKAGLMPEAATRQEASAERTMSWLERTFFEPPSGSRRAGAARLLDSKITKLRRGDFGNRVPATQAVFPAFLTYESLGENGELSTWLTAECAQNGLFKQDGVAPPLIINCEVFEMLLAFVERGLDIWQPLLATSQGPWGSSLHENLERTATTPADLRLTLLLDRYTQIGQQMVANFIPAP